MCSIWTEYCHTLPTLLRHASHRASASRMATALSTRPNSTYRSCLFTLVFLTHQHPTELAKEFPAKAHFIISLVSGERMGAPEDQIIVPISGALSSQARKSALDLDQNAPRGSVRQDNLDGRHHRRLSHQTDDCVTECESVTICDKTS